MNQVPVKWVHQERLVDEQASVDVSTLPGYIPVIPLSALREVVEGLKMIANDRVSDELRYAWLRDQTAIMSPSQWLAQRLLAGLGEVGK